MPTGLSQPLLIFGILVALLTSFRLWLRAFGRLRAGQQILPHEPRRLAPWGLVDVLGTVLLLMVLQAAALSCLPPDWRPVPGIALEAMQTDQRIGVLLASVLAELAAAGISLVAVKLRSRASWRDLGFDVRKIAADVRLGGAAFLMLAPPVYLIQMTLVYWFPSQHPLIVAIKKDPDLLFLMLSGFTAVIVAPLAEEYFFRVLLQGWCERIATAGADLLGLFLGGAANSGSPPTAAALQGTATASPASHEPPIEPDHLDASLRAFDGQPSGAPASRESPVEAEAVAPPSLWPIGLSAGLFAAMHASHGPDPIPLFLLAVGLGYLYQRTHRILPCLVVHGLLNSCSMVMLLVDVLSKIP